MDLNTTTETVTGAKRRWLIGQVHTSISIALNPALFTEGDERWPDDVIPDGTLIAQKTGTTRPEYGPWEHTATDGRSMVTGILLNPVRLSRVANPWGLGPVTSSGAGTNQTTGTMMTGIGTVVWGELLALNPEIADAPAPIWQGPAAKYGLLPNASWPDFVGFAFDVVMAAYPQ